MAKRPKKSFSMVYLFRGGATQPPGSAPLHDGAVAI